MRFLLGMAMALWVAAPATAGTAEDEAAIRKLFETSYIKGMFMNKDAEAIRAGFAKEFAMIVLLEDGALDKRNREGWIERVVRYPPMSAEKASKLSWEIPEIHITGNAAMVRLEFYNDGKHRYTDYFTLYRMPEGWRVVTKIFQSH